MLQQQDLTAGPSSGDRIVCSDGFLAPDRVPSTPAFWTRNDSASGIKAITLALQKFRAKHEHLVFLY